MSDSVSLNSTGVGNSIMAQQTQREAAMEGVELTGPWAQLWV
uniref:Uncharacterized protein n=1 Tax=Meloidogyne floridensis TaxID=298350 RepID=A0A915NP74_9BILA